MSSAKDNRKRELLAALRRERKTSVALLRMARVDDRFDGDDLKAITTLAEQSVAVDRLVRERLDAQRSRR